MEKYLEAADIQLIVPDDVKKILDDRVILPEDVKRVIAYAENTGVKLMNADNRHFISHCANGPVTLWAEYTVRNGEYILCSAYLHRIQIREE